MIPYEKVNTDLLKELLQKFIEAENYEAAGMVRDELKKRSKREKMKRDIILGDADFR